ncbi:Uncharacterised protein [BD1-7 clade bacterium]|nr:Uncharacterised protein [BD1-7 clade bacterium]
MSQQIINYLSKIDNGQHINLDAFLKVLASSGIDKQEAVLAIHSTKVSKNAYAIKSISEDFRKKIEAVMLPQNATRNEAALKGLSHSVNVDGSLLIRRIGKGHPEVVIVGSDGVSSARNTGTTAVIIENEQNFISIDKTAEFLKVFCGLYIDKKDIYLGRGGYITKKNHASLLQQYENIYLFLDLDFGGLKIAKSIYKMTPSAHHHFVLPSDIAERITAFDSTADSKQVEKCFTLAKDVRFLEKALKLIVQQNKFIEQEVFLL